VDSDREVRMVTPEPTRPLAKYVAYAFALGGLVWVLHDVHPRELLSNMRGLDWRWIVLAVCFDVLSYYAQGSRWRLLLHPVGKVSSLRATQAIYIGLFTNEIVPLRAGEIVRAFLMSRWLNVAMTKIVPSMAVERLFDSFWLAIFIGINTMFVPLPRQLAFSAEVLGVIVLVATAVLLFVVLSESREESHPHSLLGRFFIGVATGLRQIGMSSAFYKSLATSVLVIGFQALAFWCVMMAAHLRLSIWAGMAVFLIVHLGTAVPNAPANVGSFQFFCVVGLALFGVPKPAAAAFSIVVFVILTAPLWILGLIALAQSGMTLRSIRREIPAGRTIAGGGIG
jgi:uncharacterized protein (TIRG00374 family)